MLRMHPKTKVFFCALRPKIFKMYVTSVHVYNTLHELYCRYIFYHFHFHAFQDLSLH